MAHELLLVNISDGEKPELAAGGIVSANYFDVLGVKPLLGRGFAADECAVPGRNPVTVLAYALWDSKFHRDPNVLRQTAFINGQRFTVVGVAPEGFGGVYGGLGQELWVPVMMSKEVGAAETAAERTCRSWGGARGISIRPKPRRTFWPNNMTNCTRRNSTNGMRYVLPLSQSPRGIQASMMPFVAVLMAIAGLVLLIACANVANLLLARSTARAGEIGLRLALGASRRQLIRQLLTESVLLAAFGGLAGILITFWTADSLRLLLPSLADMNLSFDLSLNAPVFAFCFTLILLTAVLFGLAPAIQGSRADLGLLMKDMSRTTTPRPDFACVTAWWYFK